MTIPLAHFGHWYVQIIFAVPVLLLAGALGVDNLRKRRGQRRAARGARSPR